MLTKAAVWIGLLAAVVLPAAASGKDMPFGKWWRLPAVADRLQLSDEQKRSLDEMFSTHRRNLISLKSAVEKEQLDLEDLLESQTLEDAAAVQQFKKLEQVRSSIAEERFRFILEVRKVLGPERFQQLKAIVEELRAQRGHGDWYGPAGRQSPLENSWPQRGGRLKDEAR